MSESENEEKKQKASIGGVFFLVGIPCLAIVGLSSLKTLPKLWDSYALAASARFAAGLILGIFLARIVVKGKLRVLIHEFKHSLVSGLVGNRAKSLHVNSETGHFEYEYSSETEKYNAIIALAPYWIPLFSIIFVAIGLFKLTPSHLIWVFIVGIGYGIDLVCNFEEVSPHQTDLNTITGGFWVGLTYVLLINLTVFALLLAWVFQDLQGLKLVFYDLAVWIVNWISQLKSISA